MKRFGMELLIERIVVNILRVCIRLLHEETLQKALLNSLQLLQRLYVDNMFMMVLKFKYYINLSV